MLNTTCRRIQWITALVVPIAIASAPLANARAAPLVAAPVTAADSPQAWHLQALNDLIKNMDESIAKLEPAPGDTTNTADIGFDTPVIPSAAFSSAGMNLLGVARASEKERGVSDELANNPVAADDFLSRAAGMTQSETSIAWCGKNAVVGFNDSGSYVATLVLNPSPSPSFSYSFTGWSVSHDAGNTFTDRGILLSDPLIDPPGTTHFRDLFGDPVVRCTDSSTFYFINIAADTFIQFTPSFTFQARSGVSISRSTDGGNNFGGAAMAVAKSGFTHFIDKPWLAVSPGATRASDTIVVTYTDFDFSGTSTTCPRQLRTAIESVRSTDGGATWSSPVVLDTVCGFSPAVQGALVATGLGKDVFVAWERFANFPEGARDVRIRKSADGGATFGPASIVSSVNPIGNGFYLQGHFRAFIDLQGLAVDTSGGPNSGAVYVSWHDGRNKKRSDVFGYCPLRNRFGRCIAPRVFTGGAE